MGLLCVKMNAYLFFTLLFNEIGLYFMTLYCLGQNILCKWFMVCCKPSLFLLFDSVESVTKNRLHFDKQNERQTFDKINGLK